VEASTNRGGLRVIWSDVFLLTEKVQHDSIRALMQCPVPSVDLPTGPVVDSLGFARDGGCLEGTIQISALSRLADVVTDDSGSLSWRVVGERQADGKSYLHLTVIGELQLRCQRCLEPMAWRLHAEGSLQLVSSGKVLPDEDLIEEVADPIVAEKEMALLPLVEDEVLLALPIAPRHEACALPVPASDRGEKNPFALLAHIKTS
jgi:uncharacterized protein